jgi:phospholipase/lecithinase/hemolysin
MMKKLIVLLLLCLVSISVYAKQINNIIFFGDSLSDNGNLYRLTLKYIPKSPPYFEGRFSNGPTWAENVGHFYKNKIGADYQIYAVGGATSIYHAPSTEFIEPSDLTLELDKYLFDAYWKDKSTTLYAIWIGGNDYLFDRYDDAETLTTNVVANISWAITKLINGGAKSFLVMDLPNLARIPFAETNGMVERLNTVTPMHNQKLAAEVKRLQAAYPDVKITFVSVFNIMTDMLDHPEKYNQQYHVNIVDTKQACWQGSLMLDQQHMPKGILNSPSFREAYAVAAAYDAGMEPCAKPDESLFWDKMHPTAVVHQVLANIIEEQLQV